MTKADKLKTKRERIVHNERMKLIANLCTAGAVIFIFVIAWQLWEATAILMNAGDYRGLIAVFIQLALVLTLSFCLFMVAWTTLDKMVDPDKPAPKPKPRKPRAKRSK